MEQKDYDFYVVGGGPSLRNFDWSLLDDKRVIAVNHSWKYVKNPEYICWMDSCFHKQYEGQFPGCKKIYRRNEHSLPPDSTMIEVQEFLKEYSLLHVVGHKNKINYSGELGLLIGIALSQGKGNIYLLGYDAGHDYKLLSDSYFHTDHIHLFGEEKYKVTKANQKVHKNQVIKMEQLQEKLRNKGIKYDNVFNLNLESNYTGFEKISLNQHFYGG